MALQHSVITHIVHDIQDFFTAYHPRLEPDVEIADEWLIVKNFPLPSKYGVSLIALLLVLEDFPEKAPAGVYIPKKHPARAQLGAVFHAFDDKPPYARAEALGANGWTWLCNGFRASKGYDGLWQYAFTTQNGRDSLGGMLATFQTYIK